MHKLTLSEYKKVIDLVKSEHLLCVKSVIHGVMPGEIYVNDPENPTAALILTSEYNVLAGSVLDQGFNKGVSDVLDFWDPVIPDNDEWANRVQDVHPDRFIRKYDRCYYEITEEDFIDTDKQLPDGYICDYLDPEVLRSGALKYPEKIMGVLEDWGSDENFIKNGGAVLVRNESEIVSWSPWDCTYHDAIEIGVETFDLENRQKGFGIVTVAESVKRCFERGYRTIGWHCVEMNKGSRSIAERLGFKLKRIYQAFTPYPPIENLKDLNDEQWRDWAQYYENAAYTETRLWTECLLAYIKANDLQKAQEILKIHSERKPIEHDINGIVRWLHGVGMATNFPDDWGKIE